MKLRHVGIVVGKMEESVSFYKIFGFKTISDEMEFGKHIDNFFDKESLFVRIVKMKNEYEDCIELLCFRDIYPIPNRKSLINFGLTHIAIEVENISEIVKEIEGMDFDIQTTPTNHKVLFIRDPNGVFVELVEVYKC